MASARKVTEKRHNPVERICRKIRAIQKGEEISNPIRQIVKYQSSSFDSPWTNTRKDLEEVLKKMMAAPIPPTPNTHFSGSEKDDAFISSPPGVPSRAPPSPVSALQRTQHTLLSSQVLKTSQSPRITVGITNQ